MRYIIDIERSKTKIEIEKITDCLCMITTYTPDDVTELVINSEQLYDLIGSLHLVQNQMKKK
jgi:hypothetical protein